MSLGPKARLNPATGFEPGSFQCDVDVLLWCWCATPQFLILYELFEQNFVSRILKNYMERKNKSVYLIRYFLPWKVDLKDLLIHQKLHKQALIERNFVYTSYYFSY